MRYRWDIIDLKRALDKVKRIIDSTQDIEEKFYYQKVYDDTLNLIFAFSSQAKEHKHSVDEKIQGLASDLYSCGCWYSLVRDIYCEFEEVDEFTYVATDSINARIKRDRRFSLETGSYITHDKTVEMTKRFYERFDSELYEYFKKIYERRYRGIEFFKPIDDHSSECFYVDGAKRCFINIANNRGIKKYTDLVHECGHGIEFLMNPKLAYDDNLNYFTEVASIFPELVAFDEGFSTPEKDDYIYQYFCSLAAALDEMTKLVDQEVIVGTWMDNGCKVDKKYYQTMKEHYKISRWDISDAIKVNIKETGCYITSLKIALELLYIYKRDKKEALLLFKKLLTYSDGRDINAYYMSLIPYNNASKELDCFKNQFRLLLERKGIKL